jgi:hypothetical protein
VEEQANTKVKKWWHRDELVTFIPSFDEYASNYVASLPKPERKSPTAALRDKVAELESKLAAYQPPAPTEAPAKKSNEC